MKNLLFLAAFFVTGVASASSITILNHSFEDPTLSGGSFYYSPTLLPGWSATATGGNDSGIWNTPVPGKDGFNVAFAYRNNAIAQQLDAVLKADRTYTLSYLLGRPGGNSRATMELWAGGSVLDGVVNGGTLLASETDLFSHHEMREYDLKFTSASIGAPIGEALTVRIAGTTVFGESYVSFDNIRLTEDVVPEPATLAALGLGLIGLARRRRRN